MGKTRGKTTRESSKSGEKWRFFEGLKRHFALLGAAVAQAQAIYCQGFISVEPGWCDPPKVPRIGCMAPFFRIERVSGLGNSTVETGVAVLRLQNDSRWQQAAVFGKGSPAVSTRDVIDNEFFQSSDQLHSVHDGQRTTDR